MMLSSAKADPLVKSKARLKGSNFIRSLLGLDLEFMVFDTGLMRLQQINLPPALD
jgi:hypothetical protein